MYKKGLLSEKRKHPRNEAERVLRQQDRHQRGVRRAEQLRGLEAAGGTNAPKGHTRKAGNALQRLNQKQDSKAGKENTRVRHVTNHIMMGIRDKDGQLTPKAAKTYVSNTKSRLERKREKRQFSQSMGKKEDGFKKLRQGTQNESLDTTEMKIYIQKGRLDELSSGLKRRAKFERGKRTAKAGIRAGAKKVFDSPVTGALAKGVWNTGQAAGKTVLGGAVAGGKQIEHSIGSVSRKVGAGQGKEAAKEVGRGVVRTGRDTVRGAYRTGKKEIKGLAKKAEKALDPPIGRGLKSLKDKISKGLEPKVKGKK